MVQRGWVGRWCHLSGGGGVRRVHRRINKNRSSSSTNNNRSSPRKRRRKEKQTTNNARRRSTLADRRLLQIRRRQARCRDQARRRRVAVIRLRRSPNTRMGTTITTGIGNSRRLRVVFQLLLLLLPHKPHPHTLPPVQIPLPPQTRCGHFGPDLRTPLGVAAGMERCHRRRRGRWHNLRRRRRRSSLR